MPGTLWAAHAGKAFPQQNTLKGLHIGLPHHFLAWVRGLQPENLGFLIRCQRWFSIIPQVTAQMAPEVAKESKATLFSQAAQISIIQVQPQVEHAEKRRFVKSVSHFHRLLFLVCIQNIIFGPVWSRIAISVGDSSRLIAAFRVGFKVIYLAKLSRSCGSPDIRISPRVHQL